MFERGCELVEAYQRGLPDKELRREFVITRPKLHMLLSHWGVSKRDAKVVRDFLRHRTRSERYDDLLECRVCGGSFRVLREHLRIVHKMTLEDYRFAYANGLVEVAGVHILRSEAAKRKYQEQPSLREALREVGRRNMTSMNERGLGWRMPVGFHTEEHKRRMSELLTGRVVTWNDKIKASHWTKRDDVADIVDRIVAGNKNFKRGWYRSTKTNRSEFYHSSFEERRMLELDADSEVVFWTKRHGIRLPYECRGKCHVYVPDFLIQLRDGFFIEETKGYIRDRDGFEAKCDVAKRYCEANGMTFIINEQRS